MNQHSPFARFIARAISAIAAIGDTPHDSDEEKLAHHRLIYMGALMSCGLLPRIADWSPMQNAE